MHIHIDQGVNFSELAKNIKIQKLGKWLLAHFGCILAHCAAVRYCVLVFVFSYGGTENIQTATNHENMEGGQLFQSHSYAQHQLQPQTCV